MRPQWLSRIGVRVAVPAVAIAAVLALLLVALQLHAIDERREAVLSRYVALLAKVVLSNLNHAMLNEDHEHLHRLLARTGEIEPIVGVRVVAKSGKVAFASDPSLVGETLDRHAPSCLACHAQEPPARRHAIVVLDEGSAAPVFRAIEPVPIQESCRRCHEEPAGAVAAILMIDLDSQALSNWLEPRGFDPIWLLILSFVVVLGVVGLVIRQFVVLRLRNLRTGLDLLRRGAGAMSISSDVGDEIDAVTRSAQSLVLDLEERLAVEGARRRVAAVLERHRGPVLMLDSTGHVLAANAHGQALFSDLGPREVVGQERASLGHYDAQWYETARSEGCALPVESQQAPVVVGISNDANVHLGFVEMWPDVGDGDDAAAQTVAASAAEPAWRLYAAVLMAEIAPQSARGHKVVRFDPRLSLARRLVRELAEAGAAEKAERTEVDLRTLCLLVLDDLRREMPRVHWHPLVEPPIHALGAKHQLRVLVRRLGLAAGRRAGDGGHVVLFTQRESAPGRFFVGAWASGSGEIELADPPGGPPLVAAVSRAHGGGFEVHPRYDIRPLIANRGLRLQCDLVGALFVAESRSDDG